MFFDTRLWQFTRGVRLRIAGAVAMGVFASLIGIGRLALLGWLLARVFAGDTFAELGVPFVLVAAVMVLRGWVEHARAMFAHRTAAMVQLELRKRLCTKVVELGSRPLRARTYRSGADLDGRRGGAARDLFRRIPAAAPGLPGHSARRLRAARILRLPRRRADVRIRDAHSVRSGALPALGCAKQHAPVEGVPGIRGGVPRRRAGACHPQGLRPEHRARPTAGRARA